MWSRRLQTISSRFPSRARRYHSNSNILDDLSHRGLIQALTNRNSLDNVLRTKSQTIYAGVDPTASSLHIGHLIPLICLLHFQLHGHKIIPLIGGATGRVGDPSGRLTERQPADTKRVEENVVILTASLQRFFKQGLLYAQSRVPSKADSFKEPSVLNNLDWNGSFTLLDFLQGVGIHSRVNTMLNRESVRSRLESRQGLSFTEFTYQLLQAYDFYHLHQQHGCTIQIGGSDQWGNIVAGLELINKLNSHSTSTPQAHKEAFGITTPLLTTSNGQKFGKSAGNAVWLDPELTSVFDFYQYFVKITDADVGKYLKLFTFLPTSEIDSIVEEHLQKPEKRIAQHKLAEEVTEMVHGKASVARARTMSELLFGSNYDSLRAQDIIATLKDDPRLVILRTPELLGSPIIKHASKYGLAASNSAAKNLVTSRGLYLNNRPIKDARRQIEPRDLLDGSFVVLRAGKDKLLVLVARPDDVDKDLGANLL
ncbi:hypothetical protein CPB83DRAFT_858482 [Crepidotus variabilis]|uniref:Tyrosine--tRNA ligase n=1 Tax=Crepidotus variabilis TaxID=179855 RepID=A0A9P6EAX4_9AGAR|nr:hypothetical protein CPB83DRAFT_858482 [Crepidotus variabilis]